MIAQAWRNWHRGKCSPDHGQCHHVSLTQSLPTFTMSPFPLMYRQVYATADNCTAAYESGFRVIWEHVLPRQRNEELNSWGFGIGFLVTFCNFWYSPGRLERIRRVFWLNHMVLVLVAPPLLAALAFWKLRENYKIIQEHNEGQGIFSHDLEIVHNTDLFLFQD